MKITRLIVVFSVSFILSFSVVHTDSSAAQSKAKTSLPKSYCCHDGQVYSVGSKQCSNQADFYQSRQEAQSACSKPVKQKQDLPSVRQTSGYCCSKGVVSKTSINECEKQKGSFHTTQLEAKKVCYTMKIFCCVDGELKKTTVGQCNKQQGHFNFDHRTAERECGQTKGYCCDKGDVSALTKSLCDKRKGTFSVVKADSDRQCMQMKGFCCLNGEVNQMTKGACVKRKGVFSVRKSDAQQKCRLLHFSQKKTRSTKTIVPGFSQGTKGKRWQKLPDLGIEKVWLDDSCQLHVRVKNAGGPISKKKAALAHIDISSDSGKKRNSRTKSFKEIDPGGKLNKSGGMASWDTGLVVSGKQKILVLVDSKENIPESNENNNRYLANRSCSLPAIQKTIQRIKIPDGTALTVKSGVKKEKGIKTIRQESLMSGRAGKTAASKGAEKAPNLEVHQPVRGDYITRGFDLEVAWSCPASSNPCLDSDTVSIRLIDNSGYNYPLYSGAEGSSVGGVYSKTIDSELLNDVPDGHHYSIIVEKAVPGGECRGESWEFSVGPIRSMEGSDLAPGERRVEIIAPRPGAVLTAGSSFRLRWRVYPLHVPAAEHFITSFQSADSVSGSTMLEHLGGSSFEFDNETRIYSADIPFPCNAPSSEGYLVLALSYEAMTRVEPITIDGIPEGRESIHVLDPRPGIIKHLGDSLRIRWSVEPWAQRCGTDEATYSIGLCNAAGCEELAAVSGDVWETEVVLGDGIEPGDYRVVVVLNEMIAGGSPLFTIVDPLPSERLTLLWPNRSTTFIQGRTYAIRWTGMDDAPGSRGVGIELHNSAGRVAILGSESANRGRFDWDIPLCSDLQFGENLFLKLIISSSDTHNTTSVPFSIIKPGIDTERSFPRPGERWEFGTTRTITWNTSTSFPAGSTIRISLKKGGDYWLTIADGVNINRGRFDWVVGEERAASIDHDGPELEGVMATGFMGGVADLPGDDYSIFMEVEQCREIYTMTAPFSLVD